MSPQQASHPLVQWCILKAMYVSNAGLQMQLIIPQKMNSILISAALCQSCRYWCLLLCLARNFREQ
jgi:hypothetical protein